MTDPNALQCAICGATTGPFCCTSGDNEPRCARPACVAAAAQANPGWWYLREAHQAMNDLRPRL